MVETVLVAVDDSEPAWDALEFALERHADADLVAFHAAHPLETVATYARELPDSDGLRGLLETAEQEAARVTGQAQSRAQRAGVDVAVAHDVGHPAECVVDAVPEHDADLVVLGSHGREGVSRVLLGSVAEQVVRRSPVPVTVVR